MRHNYNTEDGCYFSDEDFLFYVKWKVEDLYNQEYTIQDILNFDDSKEWYDYTKAYLKIKRFRANKQKTLKQQQFNHENI